MKHLTNCTYKMSFVLVWQIESSYEMCYEYIIITMITFDRNKHFDIFHFFTFIHNGPQTPKRQNRVHENK